MHNVNKATIEFMDTWKLGHKSSLYKMSSLTIKN